MIATGTDVKPLEIVMFMRSVKSRNYFEQMKGRGVRVIDPTDFQAVTPDAPGKTHFVIVDCVGQCEQVLTDTKPLERKPSVAFEKLLQSVAFGSTDPDILSSLASRLARLERQLGPADRQALADAAHGQTLGAIAAGLLAALDPDRHIEAARAAAGLPADAQPTPEQVAQAAETLRQQAAAPLAGNLDLRRQLLDMRQRYEQTIDTVSKDTVLEAGYSADARERAGGLVASFEAFLREHKDEITALQVLYSRPYAQRLRLADVKALAAAIKAPFAPARRRPRRLARAALAGLRDAGAVEGPGRGRPSALDRHRLAGPVRAPPGRRACPVPRAGRRPVPRLARPPGGRGPHVHRRATRLAGTDPRPHRGEPGDRPGRLRHGALQPEGRAR